MKLNSYIPSENYKLKTSSDDDLCVLKFSKCDDKFPLWDLNKNELKEFINYAKLVEKLPWKQIRSYKGLKYEMLKNYKKPSSISKDITIHSMRASKTFRIIGFKENNYFYIIWFDKNHNTC